MPLAEYGAVMAFGGGMQADQEDRYPWLRVALDLLGETLARGVPTLGVCLGGQMLARAAGGAVGPAAEAEWGWRAVELTQGGSEDPLFAGLERTFDVFQWHSYAFELPPGAVSLARNSVCLQSFRVGAVCVGSAVASGGDRRDRAALGQPPPTRTRRGAGHDRPARIAGRRARPDLLGQRRRSRAVRALPGGGRGALRRLAHALTCGGYRCIRGVVVKATVFFVDATTPNARRVSYAIALALSDGDPRSSCSIDIASRSSSPPGPSR